MTRPRATGPAPFDVYTALLGHELRTPVATLQVYLHLLSQQRLQEQPEVAAEFLSVVADQVDRLSHLVSELTAFAQLSARGEVPDDLAGWTTAGDLLQDLARQHEAALEVAPAAEEAIVDLPRLALILEQLLDNARKFGDPANPDVRIRATVDEEAGILAVYVSNRGPRVPEAARHLIFEPYRQVEAPRERRVGGLGLGLTVARHAAEGGYGSLSLEPGTPTTFRLQLPLRSGSAADQARILQAAAAAAESQALRAIQDLKQLREDVALERDARALAEAQQLRAVEDFRRARDEAIDLAAELSRRERRLQQLVGHLLVAQEEERRRISYDIHDGLAQIAAATQQHLEAYAARAHPRSAALRHNLDRSRELAQETVREARRVLAGLRPTALDDFGLSVAVNRELDVLREDGWEVEYEDALGSARLPALVETTLFRIAQEALTNARRHAETRRIRLTLRQVGGHIRLDVRDWGRGFQLGSQRPGPRGEHMGLASIRERATLLGGRATIRSAAGAGTRVRVEVPFSPD